MLYVREDSDIYSVGNSIDNGYQFNTTSISYIVKIYEYSIGTIADYGRNDLA